MAIYDMSDYKEGARDETKMKTYDVCIVGSGPAGMTLAAELAESGLRICVLESGGVSKTPQADSLRTVHNLGTLATKPNSRERVFGGTSLTWGGLSAPMDEVDMIERPYLTDPSSWPITLSDLSPYYRRAGRYGYPDFEMFGPAWAERIQKAGDMVVPLTNLTEKTFIATDPPWNFGKRLQHIFYHPSVDLYLNATVTKLVSEKDPSGVTRVTRVEVAVPHAGETKKKSISAKIFVLAAGGIESSRLLLVSTDTCTAGLGNEHDHVGRYVMDHPKNYFGTLRLTTPVRDMPYLFGYLKSGISGYVGFRVSEPLQKSLGILNSYLRLEPIFPWTGNEGVASCIALVKRGRFLLTWWKSHQKHIVGVRDWNETGDSATLTHRAGKTQTTAFLLWTILAHLPSVILYAFYRLVWKKGPVVKSVRLRNFMEMEPLPENRITLSDIYDVNGVREVNVDLRMSPIDIWSLRQLRRIFAEEMKTNHVGVVDEGFDMADLSQITSGSSHHIGGTRMGRDPQTSVVDPDLRVHSVDNLYICSSSVFPTSGNANPTYTISALAIRLADHLKKVLHVSDAFKNENKNQEQVTAASEQWSYDQKKKIIIIGSGKRVQADVIPALHATGLWNIFGVYAREPRRIYARGAEYMVRSLSDLQKSDLENTDYIYMSVPPKNVAEVMKELSWCLGNLKNKTLIIDTPVFPWQQSRNKKYFTYFKSVIVAEDISYMPWIEPVKKYLGTVTDVVFDRGAYRYHGIALIKALLGTERFKTVRLKRVKAKDSKREMVELQTESGARGQIIEPRDYAKGSFVISGTQGTVTDTASQTSPAILIKPIIRDGYCTGLSIGDTHIDFSEVERSLVGPVPETATITSLTLEFKRVGLARMLSDIAEGMAVRTVVQTTSDVRLDELVHYFGVWWNVA